MDQEALLPFDKPPNNNIQNFTNIEKNKQKTLTLRNRNKNECRCCWIVIFVYVLLTTLYILNQIQMIPYWTKYIILVVFILNTLSILPFSFKVKKVELIKNPYLNLITLKITKKCGCSKQYSIMLENKYLLLFQGDLILLNTINNLSEIDLDSSNIQKCPINLVNMKKMHTWMELTMKYNQKLMNF